MWCFAFAQSEDVKRHNAFFPQGAAAASKVRVYQREFEEMHAAFGSLIHDDNFFEEVVSECWNIHITIENIHSQG